jgi:hypothetical protein
MFRKILAVLLGVLVAGLVITVVEGASHALWPPPPNLDLSRPEDMARLMEVVPLPAKIAVLVAWGLGSFAGGAVAARRAPDWPRGAASVVGGVHMAGGIATLAMIPHPAWMVVGSVLVFLPSALLGAHLARRPREGADEGHPTQS